MYTTNELAVLRRKHVGRAWLIHLDLPTGDVYTHTGIGSLEWNGQTWRGISDPIGRNLAMVSTVEEPTPGVAAVINLSLSGVSEEFFQEVFAYRNALEGREASVYFALVDQETGKFAMTPKRKVHGFISAPSIKATEKNVRLTGINIESKWWKSNLPLPGKWDDADQQRRYPGDRGLEEVGRSGSEFVK